MGDFIVRFIVAAGIMGVFDALWLGVIANKLYKSYIGQLLLDRPNMTAAVAFYAIYIVGVVVFVPHPALEKGIMAACPWLRCPIWLCGLRYL